MTDEDVAALRPELLAWVLWLSDAYELTTAQLPRLLVAACLRGRGADRPVDIALLRVCLRGGRRRLPYPWQDVLARAIEPINRTWLGSCVNGFHEPKSRVTFSTDTAYRQVIADAGPPPDAEAAAEPVEPPPPPSA